ncbi:glycosyltransferase family 39 protein [Actinospica durhamensis]|uniref:Glycosyltransferase family 39 protein n=1 Tax=Actinospica durhamensis TaxID=1508375 RepID=A0A941IUC1_9ACTN|nr:glycosyltransferase family 39 protein [Actinospica durhamensis]MBR7835361.1 glycosyltransferase family 39 protein [Actinospica durhamensis]
MTETVAGTGGIEADVDVARANVLQVDGSDAGTRGLRLDGLSAVLGRHRWLLFALVPGVLVPLIVSLITGGLSIPHNDGWAYSRIAEHFARTGHISLLGWNRSALIGQFIVLGPLAASITIQQTYVLALGLIGLVCVYDLLRPSLGERNAGITALMVALWPGFGLLDTSFMTDVPAMTAMFLCMALGRRALERDSLVLFALASAAGFWGTTIRAQALAAPVALLAYAAFTQRRRTRVRLLAVAAIGVVFVLGFAVFNSWFEGLPGGDLPPYKLVPSLLDTGMESSLQTYFTVALPAAPAVFWVAKPHLWRRPAQITALVTAVLAILCLHDFGRRLFPGNYLAQDGAYAPASIGGGMNVLIPNGEYFVLVVIALVSGSLLAGLIVHKAARADRLVAAFTLAFTAGTIGTFLLSEFMYDRYLIEILPGLLAVALLPEPARSEERAAARFAMPAWAGLAARWTQRGTALVAGAVVAVLGLALLTSALVSDRARWNEAVSLQSKGVPAMRIDAGLEWLGMHAPNGVTNRNAPADTRPMSFFTNTPACYVVSESSKAWVYPWTEVKRTDYERYLIGGTAHLYVWATHAEGCDS